MTKLKNKYNKIWSDQLNSDNTKKGKGNKLRTYRLFKKNICLEKYLMLDNCNRKNELTKLQISAHNLEIEIGRHNDINADERYCKLCKNNTIEDEIHFLLKCPYLQIERTKFMENLNNKFPHINDLDDERKFVWLMSNEDIFVNKTLINMLIAMKDLRKTKLQSGK